MKPFRRNLAAAIILAFMLPVVAIADDKKDDSEEATSKELEIKACGPHDKEVNYAAAIRPQSNPRIKPSSMFSVLR